MGDNKAVSLDGGLPSSDEICLSLDEVNSDTWDKLTNKRTQKQNQVFSPKLLNRSCLYLPTPIPSTP